MRGDRAQPCIGLCIRQHHANTEDAACPLFHQADRMGEHIGTKEDGIADVEIDGRARGDEGAADTPLDEQIEADVRKAFSEGRIGVGRNLAAGWIDQPPCIEARRSTEYDAEPADGINHDRIDDVDQICFFVSGALSPSFETQWQS